MARINPNNIITPSLQEVHSSQPSLQVGYRPQSSLRGGRKTDEAIHITSFMDCHAHICSLTMTPEGRLPLPLRDLANRHIYNTMSLRGATLVATKQSISNHFMDCHAHIRSLAMTPESRLPRPLRGFAMTLEGRLFCLGFTPSRNYVNLLWINTNWVSYNLDIIV